MWDQEAIALVLDQRVSLPVVLGFYDRFQYSLPGKIELCRTSPHNWKCFVGILRIVLQDVLSDVTNIYLLLKLRVSVDDITAFTNGRKKELVKMAAKRDVEERG